MGCAYCGSVSGVTQIKKIIRQQIALADCEYTSDILNEWLLILKCIKNKNLFAEFNVTYPKRNSYEGIVRSALNYASNPCHFKKILDKMKNLIEQVKASDKC